jgi:hypothetical protein
VSEKRKEVGNSHAFLTFLSDVGKEREGRCGFVNDANGERPNECQKMGSTEKCFWSKCSGFPRSAGATALHDERMIKQAPDKWQPGFADEGASCQHLSFCSTQRPLAGFSQDFVDNFQWEKRDIPKRGGLWFTK